MCYLVCISCRRFHFKRLLSSTYHITLNSTVLINTPNVHFWQWFSKMSAFCVLHWQWKFCSFSCKFTNLLWMRNKLIKRSKSYSLLFIHCLFYNICNVKKSISFSQSRESILNESVATSYLRFIMFLEWRLMMWTNTRLYQINTWKKR